MVKFNSHKHIHTHRHTHKYTYKYTHTDTPIDLVRLRKTISGATVFLVRDAGSAFPVEDKRK